MNIELASEQDLDNILELQRKAFYGQALIYNDFTLPSLTQTIADLKKEFKEKTFYRVEKNGKIIASVRCFINNQTLYVEKLIVDPDYQNKGLGTALMQEIENRYLSVVNRYELSTGHKSARNLHFYKKLGYKELRQEPLNNNCDLIILYKNVDRINQPRALAILTATQSNLEMRLREATASDIPLLAKHHRKMFEEIWEGKGERIDEVQFSEMEAEYTQKLRNQLPCAACKAWVIEADQRVIASGAISIVSYVPTPQDFSSDIAFMHSMYTEKDQRSKRCARRIIEQALAYCKSRGIKRLILNASKSGRPAGVGPS